MPEWKQTAVGMIVTQTQYIDVHNPERYKLKFPQLIERAKAEMVRKAMGDYVQGKGA